jgi:hypothetical protein
MILVLMGQSAVGFRSVVRLLPESTGLMGPGVALQAGTVARSKARIYTIALVIFRDIISSSLMIVKCK